MMWTPNQEAAIRTRAHHVCVDAGAGSGKTRVLIDRIIDLIETENLSLDKIVAITFTDKAAAEMKDRLREAFRQKAPNDNPDAMNRWRDMERRVDTARISTIHSFCTAVLRENALRYDLDPDFTVMAEAEASLLRKQVVLDTLHALLEDGDANALCISTEFGVPKTAALLGLLVKRRNVSLSIAAHIEGCTPEQVTAQWRECVETRHNLRLESLADSPEFKSFRPRLEAAAGYCMKTSDAREKGRVSMLESIGYIERGPTASRMQELLADLTQVSFTGARSANWSNQDTLDALKQAQEDSKAFAKRLAPPVFDDAVELASATVTCALFQVFKHVDEAYREAKANRAGLDFNDLIAQAHNALSTNQDIRARLARGMRHLLIDEFQDTDSVQLSIARLLSDNPGGPALFIVGDAKQSIYDFRGAEVALFQEEKERTEQLIRLDTNFRSAPDVLGFVNHLFTASGLLAAVEKRYQPMSVNSGPLGGNRIEFLIPPQREDKTPLDVYRADEAAMIAARIDAMCRGPERVSVREKDTTRPAEFGDVALLFRASTNMYLYEAALRRRGIPFLVVGGAQFYERQEVADIHALLRILVDPWDEATLLAFLRGPIAALSDETIFRLAQQGGLVAAFHSAWTPPDAEQASRLQQARALVEDLRTRTEWPLGTLVRYVLDATEYEAIALSQFLGVQRALNVRKLADLADDFSRTKPARLSQFVHYLDDVSKQEEFREGDAVLLPEGRGPVLLMTIHKAKGLEFPITVLPDTGRKRKGPNSDALAIERGMGAAASVSGYEDSRRQPALYKEIAKAKDEADAAEHARVLYVAMTRARDWLLIGGYPAAKGSWLQVFDDVYGVCAREDGAAFNSSEYEPEVTGQAWSAIVRRFRDEGAPANVREEVSAPSSEAVQARLRVISQPLDTAPAPYTISVSRLLDLLFPSDAPDGEPSRDAEDTPEPPPVVLAPENDPLLRGTLVHKLLEQWTEDDADPVRTLLETYRPGLIGCEPLADYLRATAARFRGAALGRRLAADTDAQREAPFVLKVDDRLVSGVIDLLLSDGTIVDYKTGRHRPELHARYEFQLRLYAAAVRNLLNRAPATALLYYADSGEEFTVDTSPERTEEAIKAAAQCLRANPWERSHDLS